MRKQIMASLLLTLLPALSFGQALGVDDTYKTGKLKNGLTYYIRHNAKEPGLADFYIAQRVGSILEEPQQRGLAHFLEHMAFNGTKNFSGKGSHLGIVPWCETIGVKFGANLNAYTSVDQTVYHIGSAPLKREGILDSCLLVLHDWSNCILLENKEIDKERGVIQEEWRSRRAGMAVQRMMERVTPTVYKGTKYEDCLPIGSMDVVKNFPYKDLRDYYKKWYRPDLQAIIVVGDIDVDKVEAKIKKLFGNIPMPKNAAERVYYPVPDNDRMVVAVEKDTEQPIMLANLFMKRDATPDNEKNSMKYLRDGYVDDLITNMLNTRLKELQHQAVPPVLSASARAGQFFVSRTKDAFTLTFGCRQDNIRGSFDAVVGEAERARQYGFTESELERAKAVKMKVANRSYSERNDRRNGFYVNRALRNFLASEPVITDGQNLNIIKKFDSEITLADVNAAVKDMISDKNQTVVVYAPDKVGFNIPSNDSLEQYVKEAQGRKYEPYKETTVATKLMSVMPKAGTIVSEKPSLHGATEIILSNGVKVYVKKADYSKDQVSMRFWAEGGTSLYPDSDVPNFSFISSVITDAGVGNFDNTSLTKLLASKIVRVQPSVGNETQAINGNSSVKDIETMMQLTNLYFTSPRKDTVAFNGEINRMRSFLTNREASPQVGYNDSVSAIVYGNSPRVQPVKQNTLDKVSYDRIMQIYRERFSDASNFTMLLVGNINIDSLRPLLCQYIASLPAKGRKETFANTYPDVVGGSATHVFKKKMNTPSALVSVFYTFDEPFTLKSDISLDVLQRVMQIAYTDSVREEKGGTYGISVSYDMDKNSNPNTLVKLKFRTDPAKYEELMPIVYKQIEHIAERGPLGSSFDKAKKFLVKNYEQNIINNGYWDYVLYNQLRYGIDYHTDYLKKLNSLKHADVRKVAQDLINSNRRIEITMLSE